MPSPQQPQQPTQQQLEAMMQQQAQQASPPQPLTQASLEATLAEIDTFMGPALKKLQDDGVKTPELEECRKALLYFKNPKPSEAAPDLERLEEIFPKVQKLADLARDYYQNSQNFGPEKRGNGVVMLEGKGANGSTVVHIHYPHYAQDMYKWDFFTNPLARNSNKIVDAAKEALDRLNQGLPPDKQFTIDVSKGGSLIKVRTHDGKGLSETDKEAFFSHLNLSLETRNMKPYIGKLPNDSLDKVIGLTTKTSTGLSAIPPAATAPSAADMAVSAGLSTSLGAPGAAAALARPASPSGSVDTRSDPGSPRSLGS